MTRYLVDTSMQALSDRINAFDLKMQGLQPLAPITTNPSSTVGVTVAGISVASAGATNEIKALCIENRDQLNAMLAALKA